MRKDGELQTEGRIDHKEAIAANKDALLEELEMTIPGSFTVKIFKEFYDAGGLLGASIMATSGIVADALMLAVGPVMMVKDVADIAVHAVALGLTKGR